MYASNKISRRAFGIQSAVAILTVGILGSAQLPALAHETKCPYCKMDVIQNTKELDNETVLKYGRKRIEYRCVYCAIAQAKSEFKGDVTIEAPSETKGKPVIITRKEGKWSAPEAAVFVAVKVNHKYCQIGYRALTNKEAFDKWVKDNAEQVKDAKPLKLAELVDLAK